MHVQIVLATALVAAHQHVVTLAPHTVKNLLIIQEEGVQVQLAVHNAPHIAKILHITLAEDVQVHLAVHNAPHIAKTPLIIQEEDVVDQVVLLNVQILVPQFVRIIAQENVALVAQDYVPDNVAPLAAVHVMKNV